MRPRKLPALTALFAAATLTLTSCGTDTTTPDKIKGADDPKPSPTASKTPTTDTGKRPKIKLPSDLTYDFEWNETGDKKKDAVLHDTKQFIKAVDMAIAEQDPLHDAYLFYSEGPAAAGSEEWIQEFVDYKDRITGVKRFYDARVNIQSDDTASIVYCEDQRKAANKSIKTGKVQETTPSPDSFVIYSSRLSLDDQGIWVTETLNSERGSSKCQP